MSEKNFNYLIKEQEDTNSKELIAEIAVFFAKQYENQKIIVITKGAFPKEIATKLFASLSVDERRLITFMYCKDFKVVLDKLLEIDSTLCIPKVLIIESLHQWYNKSTPLEKIPSIYSTIIAAAQDLINVNSKILKQSCFSFITSQPDELPTNIVEMFYDFPIIAEKNCFADVFKLHKNTKQKS